jgi:RHS repeat-associated protein
MKKLIVSTSCLLFLMGMPSFATNIALNKTATASSIQAGGYEAAKAMDGNTGTRWSSASTDNEWIYVNLGSLNYIDTVKIRWENAYASEYKIQFSNDASQWTDAAHITNGANEYRSIPAGHGIAQYVKMQGIHRGTGYGYSIWEFEVIGTCVPPNNNPTDITLSNSSVAENQASATVVGTLTTTDPDAGNTFTYSLVSGSGSADNSSFIIDGSSLKTAAQFNYETKSSYSIRLRTTDNYTGTYEKQFTISVTNVNESPTDISLSSTKVLQQQPVGTVVGTLSSTDPDAGSTFTYALVSGTGSTDNASFTINGSSLKTAAVFDYNVKQTYAIRVQTNDGALTFEKQFTINVTEQNLALGKTATCSSQEGALAPGQAVDGNMSSRWGSNWSENEWLKVDIGNVFSVYKVICRWENGYGKDYKIQTSTDGSTWTDAASITNAIKEDRTITFTAVQCRYVKMLGIHRGTDWGYSLWEFEVYGNSIPSAAPTDISLSGGSVFQDDPIGTVVGTLSSTDPNYGDAFTYSLVSGAGCDNNASFTINGSQLKTAATFPSPPNPQYFVRVRSTDNGGLWFEKQLIVNVYTASTFNFPLTSYAVYSSDQTSINYDVVVTAGMVGSNGSVEIGDKSHVSDNVVAGTTLVLHDNTVVDGSAVAGSTITKSSSAVVRGSMKQNLSHTARDIPTKTVVPGTSDQLAAGGLTTTILPGDYNNLMAYANATLKLSSGTYNFRTFNTEPDVTINIDVTAGPVFINALSSLDLRDRVRVTITGQASGGAVQFYSDQSTVVDIHPYDNVMGMFTVPHAEVHIHPYTQFNGIVYAKKVTIEPGVNFNGSMSFTLDSDNDGVQDILERSPAYGTDPSAPNSHPLIALINPNGSPVLADNTVSGKVIYNYKMFVPGYSKRDFIVLTVPPNTFALKEFAPRIKVKSRLSDNSVPAYGETGKKFELVGGVFSIEATMMPGCSLSMPLALPDVEGINDIVPNYKVVHFHGSNSNYTIDPIDSVTSEAVYARVKSFSEIAIFREMTALSGDVYAGRDVYTYSAVRQGYFDENIVLWNTRAVPYQFDSTKAADAGVRITYHVVGKGDIDVFDNFKLVEIPLGVNDIKIKYLIYRHHQDVWPYCQFILKSIKFYSDSDAVSNPKIGTAAAPFCATIDSVPLEQGMHASAIVYGDLATFNGEGGNVTYMKNEDVRYSYTNIGGEGRIQYETAENQQGAVSPVLTPYYYLKDHLGSTRMTLNAGAENFPTAEATMYDSYGAMENVLVGTPEEKTKEKFTGKEFDEEGAQYGMLDVDISVLFPLSSTKTSAVGVYYTDAPNDQTKAAILIGQYDPVSNQTRFKGTVNYTAEKTISWIHLVLYKTNGDSVMCPVTGINEHVGPGTKLTISKTLTAIDQIPSSADKTFLNYNRENLYYAGGIQNFYFGKRFYDPDIGIWTTCDPKEQFFNPYSYSSNPINTVDPDGSFIPELIAGLGIIYLNNVTSNAQYASNNGGSPWNPGNWNWSDPEMSLGFALSMMATAISTSMNIKAENSSKITNSPLYKTIMRTGGVAAAPVEHIIQLAANYERIDAGSFKVESKGYNNSSPLFDKNFIDQIRNMNMGAAAKQGQYFLAAEVALPLFVLGGAEVGPTFYASAESAWPYIVSTGTGVAQLGQATYLKGVE